MYPPATNQNHKPRSQTTIPSLSQQEALDRSSAMAGPIGAKLAAAARHQAAVHPAHPLGMPPPLSPVQACRENHHHESPLVFRPRLCVCVMYMHVGPIRKHPEAMVGFSYCFIAAV